MNRIRQLIFETLSKKELENAINSKREELASAAQSVYDEWSQDEEGIDDMYGGGGICDDIAEKMCDIMQSINLSAFHLYDEYACHTSIYVYDNDSKLCFNVDISPYNYETGGGYSWKKITGVNFTPEMVSIVQVDYDGYIDEEGNPRENS